MSCKVWINKCAVTAVCVFVSCALWADEVVVENAGETNQVAETRVVVTASPITQYERTGKDGASDTVVGREQLERLSAVDLPTALRQVPGVSISRYSPIGAYGGGQGGRSMCAERARQGRGAR